MYSRVFLGDCRAGWINDIALGWGCSSPRFKWKGEQNNIKDSLLKSRLNYHFLNPWNWPPYERNHFLYSSLKTVTLRKTIFRLCWWKTTASYPWATGASWICTKAPEKDRTGLEGGNVEGKEFWELLKAFPCMGVETGDLFFTSLHMFCLSVAWLLGLEGQIVCFARSVHGALTLAVSVVEIFRSPAFKKRPSRVVLLCHSIRVELAGLNDTEMPWIRRGSSE